MDISKSIEKSQKDIALFSYRNLIESLKENSIKVIEAIYAIGDSTKTELIELLALTGEEIVESINELSKTSLIKRSTNEIGDDIFTLSDSIRDLLLITPKNIEIRSKIASEIKERKSKIREQTRIDQQLGINEFDERYIEPGTDQSTHLLIVDLNQYLWRYGTTRQNLDALTLIRNRFVDLLNHLPHSYQLHYHYSRVFRFLKDKQGEITSLNKALKYKKETPRILLSKALFYFYAGDYENAEIDFFYLIQKGLHRPQNSSPKFSYSINNCYLHSLLQLGKFDDVLEFTKDWKEDEDWMVLYGTHRATVLKRRTELRIGVDTNLSEDTLRKALSVFISIFDKEGFHNTACPEAYKLVKQIQYSIKSQCQFSSEFLTNALDFVDKYFFNLASNLRSLGLNIDSEEVQNILKTFYDIDIVENPLKKSKWYKPRTRLVYDREHIKELEAEGFTIVKVSWIPIGDEMPSYMFAKDKNDNQYYLNVDYFNGGWNRWGYIGLNTKLAIQYESSKQRNKPSPAIMIVEIDQYTE